MEEFDEFPNEYAFGDPDMLLDYEDFCERRLTPSRLFLKQLKAGGTCNLFLFSDRLVEMRAKMVENKFAITPIVEIPSPPPLLPIPFGKHHLQWEIFFDPFELFHYIYCSETGEVVWLERECEADELVSL